MELIFDDRGVVIHKDNTSVLLISDLHLGFEEVISEEKGVHFPLQHIDILERVETLVDKYDVQILYVMGDVKHTIMTDIPYNWDILPEFMSDLSNVVRTVVIPGNHDGDIEALLPRNVELADVRGVLVGKGEKKVSLIHGHAWPAPDLLDASLFIMGHSHPSVSRFHTVSSPNIGRENRRRYAGSVPVILHSKLDKNCVRRYLGMLEIPDDEHAKLVTLPSFNRIVTGIAVNSPNSKLPGPFFENSCVNLLESEVFSVDGLFLGSIGWLRERFNEMIKSKPRGD
ncbi:MAG: metallophosphoesterase [Candidatus Thorarchaeota archaeon]